jgi:hypothetical protein
MFCFKLLPVFRTFKWGRKQDAFTLLWNSNKKADEGRLAHRKEVQECDVAIACIILVFTLMPCVGQSYSEYYTERLYCLKLADKTQYVTCPNFDSSRRQYYRYKKIITVASLMEINHMKTVSYLHSSHIITNIQYNVIIKATVLLNNKTTVWWNVTPYGQANLYPYFGRPVVYHQDGRSKFLWPVHIYRTTSGHKLKEMYLHYSKP